MLNDTLTSHTLRACGIEIRVEERTAPVNEPVTLHRPKGWATGFQLLPCNFVRHTVQQTEAKARPAPPGPDGTDE